MIADKSNESSNKVDNIFEGNFNLMQEGIDEVEDFINENGEALI